uniref:NADH-plastoquinone oxidoreductase subunit 4L n=1 Tax=Santalum album TaxID=35974 RepID=A0A6M8ASD3_SANAL|nr:NADH-plastoquinone oxidoreductase subunit 4L [Santalum album]
MSTYFFIGVYGLITSRNMVRLLKCGFVSFYPFLLCYNYCNR